MIDTFDKLPHHFAARKFRDSILRHPTSWSIGKYLLSGVVVSIIGQCLMYLVTGGLLLGGFNGYIVLMLITLCLLFLILSLATLALAQAAATRATQTISVSQHEEGKAFHLCGRVLREANHSIHVISPYFPLGGVKPDATEHGKFLTEAMGDAIAKNLTDPEKRFTFVRIIQLDPMLASTYPDGDGRIPRVQIHDASMAEHVTRLCSVQKIEF